MGLDGVELVIATEETFGIKIEDAEASRTVTVGQWYELVCNKLKIESQNSCATQKAFYTLRKQIISLLNIKRSEIRPDTLVETIFPLSTRKHIWEIFVKNTPLKLPILRFPPWVYKIMVSYVILVLLIIVGYWILYATLWLHRGELNVFIGAIEISVVSFSLFWLFYKIAFPFSVYLPSSCRTLGDLSREVLVLNTEHFKPFSEKDIWVILVNLISEQLGIEKDRIKPESSFVKDLGLD